MSAALEYSAPDDPCNAGAGNGVRARESQAIVTSLDQTVQAIEGAFLSAGNILSDAIEGVGELISGLDRLTGAVDQDMVVSTTEDLKRASASLYEIPNGLARRREGLENLIELGGALGGSVSEMKRSLGYLRVFTVYVKVAAAGVREDGQQFSAFAEEISQCLGDGVGHVNAFDSDLEALDRTLRAALRLEAELAIHCADLLPETPNSIIASATGLSDHRVKVAHAATSAMALAKSVRGKVGSVLAALQIGDMTRQRVEHVREGIGLLETAAADLADAPKARVMAIGREFLNALLASARDDFDCEVQLIRRNMEGLAADAAEVLSLLEAAYGRGNSGDEGVLDRLRSNVSCALGLVDKVHGADGAAIAIGQSAASATQQLIARIDDIQRLQRDVQQMALNTRLKCSQIGPEGLSLSVIALELRQQALNLEASAAGALSHVGALERGAEVLTLAVNGSGEEGARAATIALTQAVDRLNAAGSSLQSDQADLAGLGTSVVRRLQKAASGVELQVAVGAPLEAALEAMVGLAGNAAACDSEIAGVVTEFLGGLAKSYTMAPERSVHQVVAAALAVPAGVVDQPPAAAQDAVQSLDDMLF